MKIVKGIITMQLFSKTTLCFALIALLLAACGDDSDGNNEPILDGGSVVTRDPRSDAEVCGDAECGSVKDNIGLSRSCGICTDFDYCLDNACICEDTRTDSSVCGVAECDTVEDGCGTERACGTCTDTYDVCERNACVCLDTSTDQEVCDTAECDTIGDFCGVERACGTCTDTYDVCDSNNACVCDDTRSDSSVCGLAECDTVLDGCGGERACGTCQDPLDVCQNKRCVCVDTRSDPVVCGTTECGTIADNCEAERACGTCTDTYDVCNSNVCVCDDTRTNRQVCGDRDCGTAADGCGLDRSCGTCSSPDICNVQTNVCYEPVIWIPITGDTFEMGSGTAHLVTIADFEIAKKEITASQYTACVTAGVCSDINANVACNWDIAEYGDHPINCLDWQQSADYCAWAGARLPSESEWEYAARSMGETNTYPWGEAAPSCDLAVTLLDGGDLASGGCDTDHTFAACSKTAGNTEQDLCDMAGNAGEWVQDKWDDEIEGYGHIPTDGSAYEATGTKRMYRGGAFASPQVMLENTNRNGHLDPTSQVVNIGFRCARNAP